jgi:hypothetical protein
MYIIKKMHQLHFTGIQLSCTNYFKKYHTEAIHICLLLDISRNNILRSCIASKHEDGVMPMLMQALKTRNKNVAFIDSLFNKLSQYYS